MVKITLNKYIKQNYTTISKKLFKLFKKNKFNIEISKINLLKCCEILEKYNINYRLIFGTLLGIYRDGELIDYDTDVDIALQYIDMDKLIIVIPILESIGFSIIRYDPDLLISFGRNSNYIDLYFFKVNSNNNDLCCAQYYLEYLDFTTNNTVSYMNREFPTIDNPEKFFNYCYGSNWKTPIKKKHARFKKI